MPWDPRTYLSFGAERTRPAIDLLARVPHERPRRVVDLGCGPGNSTLLLRDRWPEAHVTGVDSSEEMLAEARKDSISKSGGPQRELPIDSQTLSRRDENY
jgi:trans-aconitate 2-methyltransferase